MLGLLLSVSEIPVREKSCGSLAIIRLFQSFATVDYVEQLYIYIYIYIYIYRKRERVRNAPIGGLVSELLDRSSAVYSPPSTLAGFSLPAQMKVDVRLPGKGNSNSHGARPVY